MSKIIDAVSIVITCGDEIFAIQRQNYLKAFPGYWAFPGGKVEIEDEIFSPEHELVKTFDQRLFGAVVREGKEELGLEVAHELLHGNIHRIDLLGLAVTPDFNPFRFATYFYRFDLKNKIKFEIDWNEAKVAKWMKCSELLEQYESGDLLAVPPVIKVIETLGKNPNATKIDDLNFEYDASHFVPFIESLKGVRQLMPLSNTLPPANRTNAFLIGEEGPKVLVDPSPKNEVEYQKFKNTLNLFGVDKILLTHHHPDHHEFSTQLAREYGIPMMMSEDTFQRLSKKIPNYFNNIEINFLKEGDLITDWRGRKIKIIEVPGHDEGQIAIAADDMSWFLAGDLFQGVGTVVIGDDEGDMAKYFSTLEKIILLNPKVVFPSHGIGLGGVNILEKTLEHRRMREQEVLILHQEGKSPDEMLEKIYADVDKRLWPFAMKNILKNLEKLKKEKKI